MDLKEGVFTGGKYVTDQLAIRYDDSQLVQDFFFCMWTTLPFLHIYHISQENWILWKNESLSSTFSKDFPTMTYRATDFEKEKYRVLENESKKDIFLLCYVKANFVNHLVFLLAIKRIATNCIPSRKCFIYPFA